MIVYVVHVVWLNGLHPQHKAFDDCICLLSFLIYNEPNIGFIY